MNTVIETPINDIPCTTARATKKQVFPHYCDKNGNFCIDPVKTIQENHNSDFIKVFIYKTESGFYYGYQLKLKKLVLEKPGNISNIPYETEEKARYATRDELLSLITEKQLKKAFLMFDKVCYNQPELF